MFLIQFRKVNSLSVPQEQPSKIEDQIQAPHHKKSMWQYSRAAVDITIRIPADTSQTSSLKKNIYAMRFYHSDVLLLLPPPDAREDVHQHECQKNVNDRPNGEGPSRRCDFSYKQTWNITSAGQKWVCGAQIQKGENISGRWDWNIQKIKSLFLKNLVFISHYVYEDIK